MKSLARDKKTLEERTEEHLEAVFFRVEKESFALDIFKIAEIVKLVEITPVPKSLPFIEGIVNLRGRIIPVLDLRKRLGLPDKPGAATRIIIVRMEKHRLGLLVDEVSKVDRIPMESIGEVPPNTLQIDAEFIAGVAVFDDNLTIILDLSKLLSPKEIKLLDASEKKPVKTPLGRKGRRS